MSTSTQPPVAPGPGSRGSTSALAVDVLVGASGLLVDVAGSAVRRAGAALQPMTQVALRPPLVPQQLHPERWLGRLGREGADRRVSIRRELSRRLDVLVPAVLTEVLRRAHLTEMVVRYVDLDTVVAAVDLDAAAARLDVEEVVRRVDVDAVVDRVAVDSVVDRVDIAAVVRRVDVESVLDRIDLTAVVLGRVDLDAVLDAVLNRIDLTAVVLGRVDLDAVLDAVLNRIDLTSVVLERVDLDALVQAVLARIDLVALAEEVIDAVDLPEIIRESTGSMASDTVRGARMQGIAADEAVGRAVDRLLLRRGRRTTQAPGAVVSPEQPEKTRIPAQTDRTR
ncbi:MAG: hypothetical protein ACM3XQ_03955 [Nocardioidaceae bacterium]